MKYVQLIFSPTGGTRKVANAITKHWNPDTETIDLSDAETDFSQFTFRAEDVVLIALPSYGGRVPAVAIERLHRVHGNSAKCILVCVYGNRAYEDTLVEMEDAAKESGFTIVAAISAIAEHSIMHQYATGRPDANDKLQLKEFANRIKEKMDSSQTFEKIQIPGNRPYKKASGVGLVPRATKSCVNCGLCAKQCPVKAINPTDAKLVESNKCIACMRCVAQCPHNARKINKAMVSVVSLAIKKACSVRKECELFI